MLQAQSPPLQAHSFERSLTRSVGARYLLFLPGGYETATDRKWPLMLFLHGAGERGEDLSLVAKHGPPKIVRDRKDFPFILISPQCPAGRIWDDDTVMALLDHAVDTLRVDTARVYLTGLSMGGYGTWSVGLRHPDRFAAVVPICGGGDPIRVMLVDPSKAQAVRTLGVWAFHGAKDPVVRLEESERMVGVLRQFGATDVKLTVYPEAGHDSWTETYADPKLYEWLLEHKR
jgi:predicted peptidase